VTKREWEQRWKGKLKKASPHDSVTILTQTSYFHNFYGVDGDFVTVSKYYNASRKEWEKIHRKDITRIDALLKGIMHG
jgi:hypothetical protein